MAVSSHYYLDPLLDIFGELRSLYGDFTINQAAVLFHIARSPGITSVEIMEKTGLSDASVSRICSILSEYGNRGTKAMFLVEHNPSPKDRRVRLLSLSPTGELLFRHVRQHLEAYRHGRTS